MILNNQEQQIFNNRGSYNITGNNNKFIIKSSDVCFNVSGNHNQFHVADSRIRLCLNGNQNNIIVQRSTISYGFNGNNNIIRVDQHSFSNCQYQNGINQVLPFNQNISNNNQQQNRSRSRRRPNYQINQERRQRNAWRQENQRQNNLRNRWQQLQQQQQMQQQQMQQQQINNGFYRSQHNNMFSLNTFFGDFNRIFNMTFNNNGVQQGFIRPHQNVFVFQNNRAQQGNAGLTKQQLQLIPITKHTGPDKNCTICLCEIAVGQQEAFLTCFHVFHWDCIKDWLLKNAKCPVCQQDIKKGLSQQLS